MIDSINCINRTSQTQDADTAKFFFEEQQQHLDSSRFFLESIEESAVEKYPRVLQCKSPHTWIHGEEVWTWNLNLM